MKKIGIYGGSFDPVHHAHLILAREALETLAFDEVIFVLAAQSPHKQNRAPTAGRRALGNAECGDRETSRASRLRGWKSIGRRPPIRSRRSRRCARRSRRRSFSFSSGEDNLPELSTWHRFDDLQKLVQFVVLDRSGEDVEYAYPAIRRKIDISATTIRKRVASGQSIRYLVPEAVEEIIRRENLYQGTT